MSKETDEPPEDDQSPEGEAQAAPSNPVPSSAAVKAMTAADFVSMDNDRPKADENVLPGDDAGAAPAEGGADGRKAGRPRTSNSKNAQRMREKYARQKAERAPPPDFSDLPGGQARPAPQTGQPAPQPGYTPPQGVLTDEQYRANAEAAVTVITGCLAMGISKAWRVDEEEKEALVRDLAAVAKKHNWSAFSPEIALIMTAGMYIMSRMDDPETKKKFAWVKKKFTGDTEKAKQSGGDAMNAVVPPATPLVNDLEVV